MPATERLPNQGEKLAVLPNDQVYGFLRGRGLADNLAFGVAQEAAIALRNSPNWDCSANGRLELHIRLFRVLVDAGHGSHSAELTGELLKELRAWRQ